MLNRKIEQFPLTDGANTKTNPLNHREIARLRTSRYALERYYRANKSPQAPRVIPTLKMVEDMYRLNEINVTKEEVNTPNLSLTLLAK